MANFDRNKDGIFQKDSSIYSVFYGTDSILLEDELNETQWNIIERLASLIKQQFTNGIVDDYTVKTTNVDNIFYIESNSKTPFSFLIDGYGLNAGENMPALVPNDLIKENRLIFKLNPAGTTERQDLVFLEAWFEVITHANQLRKFGGEDTILLANNILDNRVQEETSRRLQLRWRIRSVDGTTQLNTVNAFNINGIETMSNFKSYENIYKTFVGVQLSAEGDLASPGYVYGVPLFIVNRKANDSLIIESDITDITPRAANLQSAFSSPNLTLNAESTTASDAEIKVKRLGLNDAGIRWNESAKAWEISTDNFGYQKISSETDTQNALNDANAYADQLFNSIEKTDDVDFISSSFSDIIGNSKVKKGVKIKTFGYYTKGDGGGASYSINDVSKSWSIDVGNGLYADIIETEFVNYRMFGAKMDGTFDDGPLMIKAHSYSNANKVLIKNNFGTIYKNNNDYILVQYDVDLTGSVIKITNENCIGWYDILNDDSTIYAYTNSINKSELKTGVSYFTMDDNSLPVNSVLHFKDLSAWAVRNDAGTFYDEFRGELMFHHINGLCSGPLIYGYNEIDTTLKLEYTSYNAKRLTFKGCEVSVETTPNVTNGFLRCRRHNSYITNFYVNPKRNSIGNSQFKGSIITVKDSYNVEVNNIVGNNIAGLPVSGKSGSGYVVRFIDSYRVTLSDSEILGYWGSTAANNVKELSFRNCSLNRIDIHSYFRDLNVDNCVIYDWGINIGYGVGTVNVSNSTFYNLLKPNIGGQTVVNLNTTYGLLFKGTININNVHVLKENLEVSLIKLNHVDTKNTQRDEIKLPSVYATNVRVEDLQGNSTAKFNVWKISGTLSASSQKIKMFDQLVLNTISYYDKSEKNKKITFNSDSTDGSMYDINTKGNAYFYVCEFQEQTLNDALSNDVNFSSGGTNATGKMVATNTSALKHVLDSSNAVYVGTAPPQNPNPNSLWVDTTT